MKMYDPGVLLRQDGPARAEDFWGEVRSSYRLQEAGHCDLLLLCAGGEALRCHRPVLAALSDLARRAMLTAQDGREEDACCCLHLPELASNSARRMLDAIYSFLAEGHDHDADNEGEGEQQVLEHRDSNKRRSKNYPFFTYIRRFPFPRTRSKCCRSTLTSWGSSGS